MNFPESIVNGFKNYVNFEGRASRAEYWYWALFSFVAVFAMANVSNIFNNAFFDGLLGLTMLALLIPSLAVAVRRLHDTGKSAAYLLMNLIPGIGSIIFLIAMVQDSHPGPNRFGDNPYGLFSAADYQSQQYLPTMSGRPQLAAPTAFPGYGFSVGNQPVGVPVPVHGQTDEWSAQFNKLHQQARLEVPKVYRNHYFTEEEKSALQAGRPQAVYLTEPSNGDLYLAEVAWNGNTFSESRI